MGELEKILEEAKKAPKAIVERNGIKTEKTANTVSSPDVSPAAVIITTGNATGYKSSRITDSLTVDYSATGQYYKAVSNYNQTKHWTSALGSTITTSSGTGTYYWKITSIRKNTNKVVNENTSSSYLQQDYDYTATIYYGVRYVGGIPYNSIDVSGYTIR